MRFWRKTIDDYGDIPDPHAKRRKAILAATTSINFAKAAEELSKGYARMRISMEEAGKAFEKLAKELEKNEGR